jgi:hypothetical protein
MSKLILDPALAETLVGYSVLREDENFLCFKAPLAPVYVYADWTEAASAGVGDPTTVKPMNFGHIFTMAQAGMWFLLAPPAGDRIMACLNRVPGFPKLDTERKGWMLWGKGGGSDMGQFLADMEATNDAMAQAGLVPPVPDESRMIGFMGLMDGKKMVRCPEGPLHPVRLSISPMAVKDYAKVLDLNVKLVECRAVSVGLFAQGLSAGETFWLEPPVLQRFLKLNLAALLKLPVPPCVQGDEPTGLLVGPRHRPFQEPGGHKEFLATAKNIASMMASKN